MRNLVTRWPRALAAVVLIAAAVAVTSFAGSGGGTTTAPQPPSGDTPVLAANGQPLEVDQGLAERLVDRDEAFASRRTAGDIPLDNQQAGALRAEAAQAAARLRKAGATAGGTPTFTGAWAGIGANPIVQVTRSDSSFSAMAGRIGALAIRPSNGQFILGAAQGGIWLYDAATGKWTPKADNLSSLAIGSLAIAPSNDAVVYAGTGEGALSGDSYFGNGILKSTDGGATWSHVSGDYFRGVSVSRLVVDPTNKDHLYAAVLRGRGGARRTTPAVHSRFGIWESTNGGTSWTLLKEAKSDANGATDVEIDPQNPNILYASFWSDAIYKSTDGGAHWAAAMNGLPAANYAAAQTRFSISLSHPVGKPATLYAGFDWIDGTGAHPARVFKSVNGAANWSILPAGTDDDVVEDYCGTQCFYDNVIEADPTNPDVVFAAGMFDYGLGSGGIFRSDDGGQTWKNLGYNQHPDFHALAFDPSNTSHVLSGSDGGVWYSANKGGRPNGSDPLDAVTWQNLNGTVDPSTALVTGRSNLEIAQFTSIATVPTVANRFWGGTQDNGTLRKSGGGIQWFDVASGDGGQVQVDPADANYVYGTYYGISPYRYTGGGLQFFSNSYIRTGINLTDRSDFYIPFVLNKENTNQLFLGTHRLYRADNAKATSAADVKWSAVSPDLTSGCNGTAPNGARACAISAIGVGGGTGVYTGSLDGVVSVSPDGQTSQTPNWTRVDRGVLPNRPVSAIAVDRSNYRIAYVAYNGFNAATPSRPGHVFRTTDGGGGWADITANLPDTPLNSIILDPSFANTLYVGTDIGSFVTYNGGTTWSQLGTGVPPVAVWQLDLDSSHRTLAAGTHGRGAWRIDDTNTVPALVLSATDAGVPVGPTSGLEYTLTLKNEGNADATGVTLSDPVPANTSFVSADNGGTFANGVVTWSGLVVPKGGSVTVKMTVDIGDALKKKVGAIVNDGSKATSAQGPSTSGSPTVTAIADPFAVTASPAAQTDGSRVGTSVDYKVTIQNRGYTTDHYTLSSTSTDATFAATTLDGTCASASSTTPDVPAGGTTTVCVRVSVPVAAANEAASVTTLTATSAGSPALKASVSLKTIAVAVDTLLVDNDDNNPDVQPAYKTALTTAGASFSTWDLRASGALPQNYAKAFKNIVWFTGNSYPGPMTPSEATLKAFLDNGGRIFVSGQDLLDQAAGTTTFVHDYLHITWDGSETQNDKATAAVHGVPGNLVSGAIGTVAIDHSVLGAAYEDQITPNGTATPAFTDDAGKTNGLTYNGTYKVVFLGFPLEAYGTAADKATLLQRSLAFFGS